MLAKFAPCLVQEVRHAENGAQYITLIEPNGGTYNVSARPLDAERPCDAARILKPFADAFQVVEITADVSGFISREGKQYLTLRQIDAKPYKNGTLC